MSFLSVRLDQPGYLALLADLDRAPLTTLTALRRTLSKTLTWMESNLLAAMAQNTGVPSSKLKAARRVKGYLGRGKGFASFTLPTSGGTEGIVFVGTKPVKAIYLGGAKQTATGVSVKGREFPHSFLATMPSGHLGIFHRSGKARLPIVEDRVPVDIEESAAAVAEAAGARLETLLGQELNYAFNVRGGYL